LNQLLRKSGVSVLLGILLIAVVGSVPVFQFVTKGEATITPSTLIDLVIICLMLLFQASWFSSIMRKSGFVEQWTLLPTTIYVLLAISIPSSLEHPQVVAINFIWLIFYHRLFRLTDGEFEDRNIFMATGIWLCIGMLLYPKSIYLLPWVILLLNQFTTGIQRFAIVLLSFIVVAFSALSIIYLYISPDWILGLLASLKPEWSTEIFSKAYTTNYYIGVLAAMILVSAVVLRQLNFMQTKNRSIIQMVLLQVVVIVITAILSGNHGSQALLLAVAPVALFVGFGSNYVKSRLIFNIGLAILLFAVVFNQWVKYLM